MYLLHKTERSARTSLCIFRGHQDSPPLPKGNRLSAGRVQGQDGGRTVWDTHTTPPIQSTYTSILHAHHTHTHTPNAHTPHPPHTTHRIHTTHTYTYHTHIHNIYIPHAHTYHTHTTSTHILLHMHAHTLRIIYTHHTHISHPPTHHIHTYTTHVHTRTSHSDCPPQLEPWLALSHAPSSNAFHQNLNNCQHTGKKCCQCHFLRHKIRRM